MHDESPGWYRWRGAIFGAIYLAGFYAGSFAWSLVGHAYTPFYAWLGARFGEHGPSAVLAIATLCVFTCWALRMWGSSYLSYGVVWNRDAQANALVVDGPFRFVRNPLYLGNLFLAMGIGSIATPFGFAIIVVGSLIFVLMLAGEETRVLRATYGATFDTYRRAVPALIPRFTPAHVPGSVAGKPSLEQGLRAEIMVAALVVGMILVALYGERMFSTLLTLWLVGWFVQLFTTRPKAA
jgi:protein-S-isoprenylcysteine O-methyltransferase Ste14